LRTRRTLWIGALALLAFAFFLLARFPAAWALAALPRDFSCDAADGTVWNGACAGLMLRHQQLIGDLAWQLHPARLLSGRLAAHVELTQAGDFVNADVEFAPGGHLWARDVHASVHLNPALLPQLPRGLGGTARADLERFALKNGHLTDLRGRIEAHDLVLAEGATTALGSYALSFSGAGSGGALIGELRDLGGPLALEGTLRMTPEPGFVLDGSLAPRVSASANLVQQLQILGAPDAQGRRSFSIVNTF
jgi:Type II secretion system (T2SS), protein N